MVGEIRTSKITPIGNNSHPSPPGFHRSGIQVGEYAKIMEHLMVVFKLTTIYSGGGAFSLYFIYLEFFS